MNLDIYEVKINPDALTKDGRQQVEDILYECQCALFLVDITSHESFEGIKNVIKVIDNAKNPYLKNLLFVIKLTLRRIVQ